MRKSFDIIGDIGIIEAENKKHENALVKKITGTYPRIKAILKKESEIKGKHRTKKYRIVYRNWELVKASGLKTSETIHNEHGCRYKLDVKKVFFNPREGTNRLVTANMVKPKERVLVMFSGIGPYAILIAKKTGCEVTCIEVNSTAMKYAKENLKLNKVMDKVKLFHSDVRKVRLNKEFDRIIMPLGTEAYKYIEDGFRFCKNGGTIHVYGLGERNDLYTDLSKRVKGAAKQLGFRVKLVGNRVVLPYSPSSAKICMDFKVYK